MLGASLALGAAFEIACTKPPTPERAPDARYEAAMHNMIEAIRTNAYQRFLAQGSANLRIISERNFGITSGRFGPMLEKGYSTRFLAQVRKEDHDLLLWKLDVPLAREDFEIRIAIAKGVVDGFWLV